MTNSVHIFFTGDNESFQPCMLKELINFKTGYAVQGFSKGCEHFPGKSKGYEFFWEIFKGNFLKFLHESSSLQTFKIKGYEILHKVFLNMWAEWNLSVSLLQKADEWFF